MCVTFLDKFSIWLTTVMKGGVGSMELVAMHAKGEGALLCRTLSYQVISIQNIIIDRERGKYILTIAIFTIRVKKEVND